MIIYIIFLISVALHIVLCAFLRQILTLCDVTGGDMAHKYSYHIFRIQSFFNHFLSRKHYGNISCLSSDLSNTTSSMVDENNILLSQLAG